MRRYGEGAELPLSLGAGTDEISACHEAGGAVIVAVQDRIIAAAGACISGNCATVHVAGLPDAHDNKQKELRKDLLTFLVRCIESDCAFQGHPVVRNPATTFTLHSCSAAK